MQKQYNTIKTEVLIIGAGLTGLATAYFLKQQSNLKVTFVEARERLGGRINTVYNEKNAPIEMGATWLGQKHNALVQLLAELKIGIYPQRMGEKAIYEADSRSATQLIPIPHNPDPSFRIEGGSSNLIQQLANHLIPEQFYTSQTVKSIKKEGITFFVKTNEQTFEAQIVVSTLPPYLLLNSVDIQPPLPKELVDIAQETHTWMGESIKVGLAYAAPFWREKVGTGTIFSNAGPINEMYDHSNQEDSQYGLKGFINGAYHAATKAQRLGAILTQLQKYFGPQVQHYLSYEETVWQSETSTFFPYGKYILPHQNNGHPIYRSSYLDGHFYVAGSETASQYPGYMDGAVRSAHFVAKEIVNSVQIKGAGKI